jgi:hypothetical protein
MKMIIGRFVLALLVAAVVPVATAGAGTLGKTEIAGLFPGQFEAKVKGYRVFFSGARNGSLSGEAYGQSDEGRWFMRGAALCVVWNNWTDGEARCGRISQQGGWYVAVNSEGEMLKFRRTDLAQK